MEAVLDRQDIIGRWTIVAWVQRYDDGRVTYPLGEHLEGFIQYDTGGGMVIMLAAADRPKFTSGGQWNASDGDKAKAYSRFMAYAGTYALADGEIRHHIDISLYPDWAGVTQTRQIGIQDGQLQLKTGKLESGTSEARVAVLTWRR